MCCAGAFCLFGSTTRTDGLMGGAEGRREKRCSGTGSDEPLVKNSGAKKKKKGRSSRLGHCHQWTELLVLPTCGATVQSNFVDMEYWTMCAACRSVFLAFPYLGVAGKTWGGQGRRSSHVNTMESRQSIQPTKPTRSFLVPGYTTLTGRSSVH